MRENGRDVPVRKTQPRWLFARSTVTATPRWPLPSKLRPQHAKSPGTPGDLKRKRAKRTTLSSFLTVADDDTGAERSTVITVTANTPRPGNRIQPLHPDCTLPQTGYVLVNGPCHVAQRQLHQRVLRASERKRHVELTPIVIDTETGEKYEFGPYPQSLYVLTQAKRSPTRSCFISQRPEQRPDGRRPYRQYLHSGSGRIHEQTRGLANIIRTGGETSGGGYIQASSVQTAAVDGAARSRLPMPV